MSDVWPMLKKNLPFSGTVQWWYEVFGNLRYMLRFALSVLILTQQLSADCCPWEPKELLSLTHMCSNTLITAGHPRFVPMIQSSSPFFCKEQWSGRPLSHLLDFGLKRDVSPWVRHRHLKKRGPSPKLHCEWVAKDKNRSLANYELPWIWIQNRNPLQKNPHDADPRGPDLGFPDDGAGLDLCGLHYGHGGLEDHLHWGHGGLLHYQGRLVLVQPVEILFYRLNCCQQLLWLPSAVVCGG